MRNARKPEANEPEVESFDPFEDDLVVTPRPSGLNPLLLPPFVAILAAVGLLIYRVNTPDWHWEADPAPRVTTAEAQAPEPAVEAEPAPKPAEVAKVDGAPKPAETPASAVAPLPEKAPQPESTPRVAQTEEEIQKEAERIRAEREELERIKKAEGERLAKIPPKRRQQPSIEQLHALAMAEMRRMEQDMAAMMNRMPMGPGGFGPVPPLGRGRGGFAAPGLPPEIERQFQEMERRQEEFLRQAEARMRAQRGAFGPNRQPRMAPPLGQRAPGIREFRFSTPDGRIQELRLRMEVNGEEQGDF